MLANKTERMSKGKKRKEKKRKEKKVIGMQRRADNFGPCEKTDNVTNSK